MPASAAALPAAGRTGRPLRGRSAVPRRAGAAAAIRAGRAGPDRDECIICVERIGIRWLRTARRSLLLLAILTACSSCRRRPGGFSCSSDPARTDLQARGAESCQRAYLLSSRTVRYPVSSGITKRESRHISQEVCPHNQPKFVQITNEEAFRPREGVHGAELIELMGMDQAEFSRRFKGSPVKRAKRRGLLRNVAVALGNWGAPEAVPVLTAALEDDEPLIRGHAAWALGRIGTESARAALRHRTKIDADKWVREEIELATHESALQPKE
jgi:hypothetical protein